MSDFFRIGMLLAMSIIMLYLGHIAIKNKSFGMSLIPFSMFILSLIGLTVEINQFMIENAVLLQVNATVIAGLLVMLSITTIWSSNQKDKIRPVTTTIRRTGLYLTPKQIFSAVVPFCGSAILSLISSSNDDIFRFTALLSMGIGFFLLALFGGIVVFSEKKEDLDLS